MLIMHLLNQLKQCLNTSTIEELTLEKASVMAGQLIQLKHPSKCNVKVTDDLYDEYSSFVLQHLMTWYM